MVRKKEVVDPISESFSKLNAELNDLRQKIGRTPEFDSQVGGLLAENRELKKQINLFRDEIVKINGLNDRLMKKHFYDLPIAPLVS